MAIHVNGMGIQHPDGPQTPDEEAWAALSRKDQIMQHGYRTQQSTKPQTLSYAMMDSPIGTAAWILEKFHGWSHLDGDDVESAHSKDDLLTNIMVYIVTRTFNTASWIYFGRREEGQRLAADMPNLDGNLGRVFWPGDQRVEVPVACALFPAGTPALAAALLRRAHVQRPALDRVPPRRPFRHHGGAGRSVARHSGIRTDSSLRVPPKRAIQGRVRRDRRHAG